MNKPTPLQNHAILPVEGEQQDGENGQNGQNGNQNANPGDRHQDLIRLHKTEPSEPGPLRQLEKNEHDKKNGDKMKKSRPAEYP